MDMSFVVDVGFILAVVAFFKNRYGLTGDKPIALAFVVSLVVLFIPDLVALFPHAAPYLEKGLLLVKLFLSAPGLFDLAVDLKNKPVG